MNGSEIVLDLLDNIFLHCVTHYHDDQAKIIAKMKGIPYGIALRAVPRLGVVSLLGQEGSELRTFDGKPVYHNGHIVPDGYLNQFIHTVKLGIYFLYPMQLYRTEEKLIFAQFMMAEAARFTPSASGVQWVIDVLDKIDPKEWPFHVPVQGGVVDKSRVQPHLKQYVAS